VVIKDDSLCFGLFDSFIAMSRSGSNANEMPRPRNTGWRNPRALSGHFSTIGCVFERPRGDVNPPENLHFLTLGKPAGYPAVRIDLTES
jgi:hypothetical protein